MKWSFKIGRIAGIAVYVHATFSILILWIAINAWRNEPTVASVVEGVSFILLLFGCVVLHELGHALTARQFGVATRDITLLPIGGVARLERMPEKPMQEFLVALAGPAVNVVIVLLLTLTVDAAEFATLGEETDPNDWTLIQRLFAVNILLVVFNLLPAFPMDGGRALRALLASQLDYVKATRLAALLGQAMAVFFGILGLMGNPFLVLIALFVWVGAAAEAGMVETRAVLASVPVSAAMMRDFAVLRAEEALDRAIQLTLVGTQKDFPVLREGELVGVLTQRNLLEGLARDGATARVSTAMTTELQTAELREKVGDVFLRIGDANAATIPVLEGGRIVGLIDLENITEYLRIRSALDESRAAGAEGGSSLGPSRLRWTDLG